MVIRGKCAPVPEIAVLAPGHIEIAVLAPDHIAWTQQAKPVLYWWTARPASYKARITITENPTFPNFSRQLIYDKTVDLSNRQGIQSVALTKQKTSLRVDGLYKFSVAVLCNPEHPSANITSLGKVRRVAASAKLAAEMRKARSWDYAYIYAKNGLWFDALHELLELESRYPDQPILRKVRMELLNQGNLTQVAEKLN
ncbi:MAG: DUF928 domain-containing protein [Gammaproteobacteria bacterium]|nr:DUF928 domain-containing protein [Gammaproteobacteria bacterium]